MHRIFKMMAVLLILGLAGCVTVGRKIDQSAAAKIEKGKTTQTEVLALLGSPDQITRTGNGDTMYIYHYMRASAKPASFIPIFGAFVGGANVQNQVYMVKFGPDRKVKNYMSTYGASETNENLAAGSKATMNDVEQGKRPK